MHYLTYNDIMKKTVTCIKLYDINLSQFPAIIQLNVNTKMMLNHPPRFLGIVGG